MELLKFDVQVKGPGYFNSFVVEAKSKGNAMMQVAKILKAKEKAGNYYPYDTITISRVTK